MHKKIKRREQTEHKILDSQLHPILQRIYPARGVQSLSQINSELTQLLSFEHLLGIDQAVSCLFEALRDQKNFLVVGDFDADGATSTALAVRALRSFGAKHVNFLVPNRFAFGYGLTPELVDAARDLHPEIIITVDNGIANHPGVDRAKELGIKVIITDHHLPGDTLPSADAIVNPNQKEDNFPSKHIAGVGVIFYVMLALRRFLNEKKWFEQNYLPEPNMSRLLDLVALGTVADVVTLDQNNRILVQQGLRRIRAGQCVPGISALLEIANRNQAKITSVDLGFAVAPRLNAAGRLDDMSLGINCLLSDDPLAARTMANQLNQLNEERRVIEQDMQEHAFSILNSFQLDSKQLPKGICLFDESWHQGVIGILASRIKEKYHRPVIAFALHNQNELKGSARSINGLHIRDTLADIATQYPHIMQKFGGHAMAAGLVLERTKFDEFSQIFENVVSSKMKEEDFSHVLMSDGELHTQELSIDVAQAIREGGPWGQGFPEPLFDGIFEVIDQRLVGGKHLKMMLAKEKQSIEAIAFNVNLNQWPNYRCNSINIAYRLDINEFRGKRNVQLIIEHMEIA